MAHLFEKKTSVNNEFEVILKPKYKVKEILTFNKKSNVSNLTIVKIDWDSKKEDFRYLLETCDYARFWVYEKDVRKGKTVVIPDYNRLIDLEDNVVEQNKEDSFMIDMQEKSENSKNSLDISSVNMNFHIVDKDIISDGSIVYSQEGMVLIQPTEQLNMSSSAISY